MVKFQKYGINNDTDLKKCKITSLENQNYDQIENFIEYEAYLQKSYFAKIQDAVYAQFNLIKNCSTNAALICEYFSDSSEMPDVKQMTWTLDLNVVLPKYSLPVSLPQETLPGETATTFDDKIHCLITENDDHLASQKYKRFNNFKHGLYPQALHHGYNDP